MDEDELAIGLSVPAILGFVCFMIGSHIGSGELVFFGVILSIIGLYSWVKLFIFVGELINSWI